MRVGGSELSRVLGFLVAAAAVASLAHAEDPATDPSDIERAVLREHNLARANPKAYAGYVEEWLRYYQGRRRWLPGRRPIWTREGTRAVREAIAFLLAQEPLPPLSAAAGLARAARDHVRDTGPGGGMGHIGSDQSEPADRVNRYGRWFGRVGENIAYGGRSARELVIRLIIDDGVRDRGHRRNIFNPQYRLAGVAFGEHSEYGTMCVITYAAEFEPSD